MEIKSQIKGPDLWPNRIKNLQVPRVVRVSVASRVGGLSFIHVDCSYYDLTPTTTTTQKKILSQSLPPSLPWVFAFYPVLSLGPALQVQPLISLVPL